jgi:fatty-acyl-CoA synthase
VSGGPAADFGRWVEAVAARAPEATALVLPDGVRVSYATLQSRIAAVAARLRAGWGIGPGDRVAALAVNHSGFLALFLACARLGAVFLPLNWRLAPAEWRQQLDDAGARLVFADPGFAAALPGDRAGPVAQDVAGFEVLAAGPAQAGADPRAAPPAEAGAEPPAAAAALADAGARPCLLVYTSGTTGRPKGAMLSHRALATVAANGIAGFGITAADRVLSFLPMFHVGGLNILTLPALRAGATVILQDRFEAGAALAAIAREKPTDLSSLRAVGAGSSVIPRELIDAFHARGVPVMQVYGATETGPTATVLPAADAIRKAGSCGLPAAHTEIDVFRDDGTRAADGERGELRVRGGNVFSGYWRDEAATRAAFAPGGWYRSGDVGHRDAEGFLFVDDRRTDLIISGGENVYPAELEAVLAAHPAVAQVAVVAKPDPRWGEAPVAFVALRPGAALSRGDALALFEGRLARFKHPRDVIVLDRLPTTALGKIEKFRLRAMLAGG